MPYIGNAPYQGSVTSVNIIDGTIDTADLKDNSVTNSKLSGITTTYVSEGTGLYYTDARARGSLSFTSGSGAYNSTTGVITIPTNTTHLTNGSGYLTGNQTVTLSGDASGSGSTAIAVTLANSGVVAGSYNNVTVNSKGLITSGSNTSYLTGNQTVTLSGDASGSGSTAITVTLANSGVVAGTYNNVTVNSKGLITSGSNTSYLTGNQTVTLSGDASGSGSTAITVTLANSGVVAGSYNNVTVNSKGLITSGSNTSYLTGNQTVTLSGDASGSGSTAITVTLATVGASKGGTGQTSLTANNVILGNGTSPVQFVAPGSSGNVLTSNGTTWTSAAASGGSSTLTISNKTAAYTIVAGDLGKIINCTSGTFTVSLTAAATLGSGFNVTIWNTSSTITDVITIDPSGAETIDGVATLILRRGEGCQIVCDGTNWQTGDKKTMRLYSENSNSTYTRPVASGDASVALGAFSTASGGGAVAIATGNTLTVSGINAIGICGNGSATSNYSTAIGHNSVGSGSQAVTGSGAMALGGSYASGTDSFATAIGNNTSSYGATGNNSIALGYNSKATAGWSVAIGWSQTASGSQAVCLGGNSSTASGNNSLAIGRTNQSTGTYSATIGNNNVASASAAIALGDGATSSIIGKFSYTGNARGTSGLSQTGFVVLSRDTTDATATALTSDTGNASTTNQVILPNNSAYHFRIQVVAMQQAAGGTNAAGYTFTGVIRRGANAAATSLLASSKTVDYESDTNWDCAVSADTTNGGLAVTVTGVAATNIRWVATCWTSEVTYA